MVGLVAARLKERYGRPAFAIALEPGGIGTGSGRSIAGVDLGQAVRRAVREGLLLKGGGHAMAAGVTLQERRARRVPRLSRGRRWRPRCEAARRERALLIDGAVSAGGVNLALVRVAGARRAVRRRQSGADAGAAGAYAGLCRSGRRKPHPRALQIRRRQSSSTRSRSAPPAQPLGRALLDNRGRAMHAAGHLAIDRWQGEERVQMRLTDVALS